MMVGATAMSGWLAAAPAPAAATSAADGSTAPTVALAASPTGGYWEVGSDGSVFAFGGAPYLGGANTDARSGVGTNIVAIAATPGGGGYWLVADNGSVFAFGNAPYLGGANTLNGGAGPGTPVVGIAAASNTGYWEAAANGAVFAYGDASYLGGANTVPGAVGGLTGSPPWTRTIVAIVGVPGSGGYWEFGSDGSTYAYGAAHYAGGANTLASGPGSPVAGGAALDSDGYWEVAMNGAVFAYGTAPYDGRTTQQPVQTVAA